MKRFEPRHTYRFTNAESFPDAETETLLRESMAMCASQYQGVCIGPWLEDRLRHCIQLWFPEWSCSHAQLTDDNDFDRQSRSWDIVLHKPVPSGHGYPPPAYPNGSYPLIPKSLVAAVIDSKGLLSPSGLRKYCAQLTYDAPGDNSIRQFDFIGGKIPKILFCFTSTSTHEDFSALCQQLGAWGFVLSKVKFNRIKERGATEYEWTIQHGSGDRSPLAEFRAILHQAVASWHERND